MPFEPTELRISLQKLLAALVLLIVPLSIIGLYITNRGDRSLEQSSGERHLAAAESASTIINSFASDRVTDCRVMASTPSVLLAIDASNKSYRAMTDTTVKDRIDRLRRNWNAVEPDSGLKAILNSGVGVYFSFGGPGTSGAGPKTEGPKATMPTARTAAGQHAP
jgi:hypothetical protein